MDSACSLNPLFMSIWRHKYRDRGDVTEDRGDVIEDRGDVIEDREDVIEDRRCLER
jgi:hypothetical protein